MRFVIRLSLPILLLTVSVQGETPVAEAAAEVEKVLGQLDESRGSTKLTADEYQRLRFEAAKFVSEPKNLAAVRSLPLRELNPQFDLDRGDNEMRSGRIEWEWLRKLRIAQGRYTPEQLATGGQPHFSGDRTHAVKVANSFDIPWSQLSQKRPSQQKEPSR